MVSFDTTLEDEVTIRKIACRAKRHLQALNVLDVVMDVTTVHANGCPLKLEELLAADNGNFAHDISGMRRHLNRDTGELQDCFFPRYAA